VMCDIWKGNRNLKQLTEDDISELLSSLQKLGTRQVLMSGGEALLNPNFFRLCGILKQLNIKITLLSTGITLEKNAGDLTTHVNDVIVSVDGDEALHDTIRNIPGAFNKMQKGITAIRSIDSDFKISGRTVIQKMNYRHWPAIIESAKRLALDSISFLPADVSSQAFNRENRWELPRQQEIAIPIDELGILESVIDHVIENYREELGSFISESAEKLRHIHAYYSALHGLNPFPYKKCNAPWVSAVVEADGSVRPCFFHPVTGNIRTASLNDIINSDKATGFRKELDVNTNSICEKCVCHLHLSPHTRL
jgi:MoaA/NifB/PqqE/SkfB family radical SAM enzyme